MNKKQLITAWVIALLLSGCALVQDKSKNNDSGSMRVSGDVTVSAINGK